VFQQDHVGDNEDENAGRWKMNFREGDHGDSVASSSRRAGGYSVQTRHSGLAGPSNSHAQSGATKRSTSDSYRDGAKRAKAHHPLPLALVTKPFESVQNLKKPFKTPFKTPFKNLLPEIKTTVTDEEVNIEGNGHHVNDEEDLLAVQSRVSQHTEYNTHTPSSPMDLPEVDADLDAAFSQKFPLSLREEAFHSIRRGLYKVFMCGPHQNQAWGRIKHAPPNEDDRAAVISAVARDVEYSIHSMCTTQSGYQHRTRLKKVAITSLKEDEPWDAGTNQECEDASEIGDTIKRICADRRSKLKGKTRVV